MLDSLKQAGMGVGRELSRAWESPSEGWHPAEAHYRHGVLNVRLPKRRTRTARSVPVR